MAPLLDIRGLTRDYASGSLFCRRHRLRALDNVSLTVEAGTIMGIVGESGCGKSTLARLVMALDRPTAGEVLFDGDDLFSMPAGTLKRRRQDFQMVFQDPFGSLDPRHTVGRIIAEPLHVLTSRPGREEERMRVADMLASVGLDAAAAARYPHEFSGGQRQRIAIARALITNPRLVVADEAVSALDLSVQAQVLNLLIDLREQRGVTFLFISHNLAVIDSIADDIAVMYRGRIVETGPAADVLDQPLHPYTQRLGDAEPRLDGRIPVRPPLGTTTIEGSWQNGCAFSGLCPLATGRCVRERPELRNIVSGRRSACHHAETMLAATNEMPPRTGPATAFD